MKPYPFYSLDFIFTVFLEILEELLTKCEGFSLMCFILIFLCPFLYYCQCLFIVFTECPLQVSSPFLTWFFICLFVLLGFKPRAWCMLGRYSTTKLHSQPLPCNFNYLLISWTPLLTYSIRPIRVMPKNNISLLD